MEIATRTRGQVEIILATGRASMQTHERLRQVFRNAMHCGRSDFVINLIHASSLDSLTIGELVGCLKRAREQDGNVKIVISAGGVVDELLQLTGLDRIFQVYGSEDEAIASFSSGVS